MAFSIRYARLFEVRILHGYYLDNGNARNFFELNINDQQDADFRKAVLERYDLLSEGLSVQPTKSCRKLLDNHRMVFRPLPFGFMVGVEVREEIQGNTRSLFPRISISEDIAFNFEVTVKIPDWHNFSGVRINPNVPANHYFSNYLDPDELSPPSLSLKTATRASRYYEMGEFVWDEGAGQLYQAKVGVDSSIPLVDGQYWEAVDDFRFVNGRDQRLLPLRFAYTFTPNPGTPVTQASFTLIDSEGNQVASIDTVGSGPFREYFLNLKSLEVPEGQYTLRVTGNDNYSDEVSVWLNEELYRRGTHFIVSIGHRANLPPALKLLEDDGSLRKEAGETEAPVFEIRYPARKTYWRYFLHPGQEALSPPTDDVEIIAPQILLSKMPIRLTKSGAKVNYDTNILLPNPSHLSIGNGGNGQNEKYVSDIYPSQIIS